MFVKVVQASPCPWVSRKNRFTHRVRGKVVVYVAYIIYQSPRKQKQKVTQVGIERGWTTSKVFRSRHAKHCAMRRSNYFPEVHVSDIEGQQTSKQAFGAIIGGKFRKGVLIDGFLAQKNLC